MTDLDNLSIQISAKTRSATNQINNLKEALGGLIDVINKIDTNKFENLSNTTKALSDGLKGLKGGTVNQLGKLAKTLNEAKDNSDAFDGISESAEKVGEAAKTSTEDISNFDKSLKNIGSVSTIQKTTDQLKNFSKNAITSENSVKGLKGMLASLKIIVPTEGLDKATKKFEAVREKAKELADQINFKASTDTDYVDSNAAERDKAKLNGLINELERLKLKQKELEAHGGFRFNTQGLENFGKSLAKVSTKISQVISKLFTFKEHTKSATKSADKFSISNVKLSRSLLRTSKMLKLMITRMILRKMISNVTDGFNNLAQYSDKFNASLSLLWNSFRQLGNSVAAAVSPLINALAPALNYIIQLVIKCVNVINQLISALCGLGTWTKAKKLSDDYAKSLEKGAGAAKELKKTVLGFDELNQLQDNKGGGGGSSLTDPKDMFETAEIEAKWKNLAEKIKGIFLQILDPIKKAWENVGDYVVECWKRAFKSVGTLLKDIGKDFLEVWNQPETIKALENVFKSVGNIGRVVDALATKFDIAWKKNETGKKILENIRDIFAIIAKHLESITRSTALWALELNFSPLLTAFKEWLSSIAPVVDNISQVFEDFYNSVLLKLTRWTLEKGLPDLLQVFTDFNNKVDWAKIQRNFKELWKHLEPFAERVGEGLILFINEISQSLANFINSKAFTDFLTALGHWMDTVDAEDIANALKVIAGGFMAFKGFEVLKPIIGIIQSVMGALNFSGIAESIGAVAPAATGAVAAIAAIVLGLKDAYDSSEEIQTSFKNATSSIRDALAPAFEYLKEDILPGLKDGWDRLKDTISPLTEFIRNAFASAWTDIINPTLQKLGDEVLPPVIDAFEKLWKYVLQPLGSFLSKVFKPVIEVVSGTMKVLWKDVVVPLSNFMTTIFLNAFKAVADFFNNTLAPRIKIIMSVLNVLWDNALSPLVKKLEEIFLAKFKMVFSTIGEYVDNIKQVFGGLIDFITGVFSGNWARAWEGVGNAFKGVANNIVATVEFMVNAVIDALNRFTSGVRSAFNSIASKMGLDMNLGEIPHVSLPRFQRGGFPKDDSLFMMNSSEMVGKFSNGRNAVANNQQITDGIAQAVYSAIMSANSNSNGGQYINNTIQIDGETIARAVTKGQQSINRRYSPTTV